MAKKRGRSRKRRGSHHDKFFRSVMHRKENAAGILRVKIAEVFSPALSARFDWGELKRLPDSFVTTDHSARYSDILYSVPINGRPAFVYCLIEHQSSNDPVMAYRMLRYMDAIWDQYFDEHPTAVKIPAIVPLVVHCNPDGQRWSAPTEFADLLDLDPEAAAELGWCLPRFRFLLEDLTATDLEVLRRRDLPPETRLMLVALKIVPGNRDPRRDMLEWREDLYALATGPEALPSLQRLMNYIWQAGEVDLGGLAGMAEDLGQIHPSVKEAVVTTAEMLEARGEARGKVLGEAVGEARGEARGKALGEAVGEARAVLNVLEEREVGVTDEVRDRVLACTDRVQLREWLRRALVVNRATEIFD